MDSQLQMLFLLKIITFLIAVFYISMEITRKLVVAVLAIERDIAREKYDFKLAISELSYLGMFNNLD